MSLRRRAVRTASITIAVAGAAGLAAGLVMFALERRRRDDGDDHGGGSSGQHPQPLPPGPDTVVDWDRFCADLQAWSRERAVALTTR